MNYQQLMQENDYMYPYSYGDSVTLSSNTAEASFEISVGNIAMYSSTISLTIIDDAGLILDPANSNPANYLTVQIEDESGNKWFKTPINVFDFQKWATNFNFKGIVLPAQKKYTVTITASAFPATPTATFPLKVSVFFIGLNRTEKNGQALTPRTQVLI
jgi:hypothetical protein